MHIFKCCWGFRKRKASYKWYVMSSKGHDGRFGMGGEKDQIRVGSDTYREDLGNLGFWWHLDK